MKDKARISPKALETKIIEFANIVDPDTARRVGAAHNELPHLDLHCLPSFLLILDSHSALVNFIVSTLCSRCHLLKGRICSL